MEKEYNIYETPLCLYMAMGSDTMFAVSDGGTTESPEEYPGTWD